MVDQPAAPAPFVIGPDGAPIILSELRWPFEELGARDVPRELPIARPDVQLTVSMLAAMRDGVPSLVQYDDAGRVLATGDRIAAPSLTVGPTASGFKDITLTTGVESVELKFAATGAFAPSVSVVGRQSNYPYQPAFTPSPSGPFRRLVQVDAAQDDQVRVQVDNSNELLAFVTCLITLVKAVEEVVVFSNPGQEPSVTVIETGPTRVYDLRGFSGPGAGVAPSLVFAPNANRIHELDMLTWAVVSAAAAGALRVQVLDGAVVIWETLTSASGVANSLAHGELVGLGLKGTAGQSMTVTIAPGLAGAFEEVAAGVYDLVP